MLEHESSITNLATNINNNKKSNNNVFLSFTIFLDSIKIIFLQNPILFSTLYLFTTFPLSLLLTSSAVSTATRHLKHHIHRLEWLFHAVPIWVEAENIRDESRIDSRKLLESKFIHGVPVFVFSLVGLVSIVGSTYAGCKRRKKVALRKVMGLIKVRWGPPLLTCLVNFIVWVGWACVDPYLNSLAVEYGWCVTVVQVMVEVYIMTVLAVGLVMSVIEGRVGFEAFRAGWELMRGSRVCGWVLSGLVLLGSGFIGKEMVGVMEGRDDGGGYTWAVGMRVGCMMGLVILLGWFILWSYVIFTVYYFECRKRNVIKKEEEYIDIIDENDIII